MTRIQVPQACFGGRRGPYVHVGKFVLVFANGDVVVDPSVIEKNFLHEVRCPVLMYLHLDQRR